MPNHIISVVTAKPSVIQQLLDDDGVVDFNRIIPQPPNIETGNCPFGSVGPNFIHRETGKVCWHEWNIANWGTKWGGYEQRWITADGEPPTDMADAEPVTLSFQTAWAVPLPIFAELARRNRSEPIHIEFADEDLGSNVGILDFNLDRDVYFKDLQDTDEGKDLACKLHLGQTWAEYRAEQDADDEPAAQWVDSLIATVRAADGQR